jgi:hypothetical protein
MPLAKPLLISQQSSLQDCLKIAVWHHPLNSAFEDRITDHGFMEQLAKADFRFALTDTSTKAETSLYSYDLSAGGRKLNIICAGTFGAPIREWVSGYPLQYNRLRRILNVGHARRSSSRGLVTSAAQLNSWTTVLFSVDKRS